LLYNISFTFFTEHQPLFSEGWNFDDSIWWDSDGRPPLFGIAVEREGNQGSSRNTNRQSSQSEFIRYFWGFLSFSNTENDYFVTVLRITSILVLAALKRFRDNWKAHPFTNKPWRVTTKCRYLIWSYQFYGAFLYHIWCTTLDVNLSTQSSNYITLMSIFTLRWYMS
jgi:hypothetical protein